MRTVLITGAAGFIAPHVKNEFLRNGWKVVGVDISEVRDKIHNVEYLRKDVRELTPKDLSDVDVIVHLAFRTNIPFSVMNPVVTTSDNIGMTTELLKLSSDNNVKRFVFPSTASLFGNNPIPWSEDLPPDAIEPYSWQKLCGESLMKMWNVRYGLETVTLRFYQIYGENQREDTALAAFIRAKIENRPITLTETTAQSSFKTARRDFIYVGDVASAVYMASTSKNVSKGEIINIGSGKATEIGEIARVIGGEVKFIPRRNFEVECHLADVTLAKKLLGWSYKVEVLEWLEKFIATKLGLQNVN